MKNPHYLKALESVKNVTTIEKAPLFLEGSKLYIVDKIGELAAMGGTKSQSLTLANKLRSKARKYPQAVKLYLLVEINQSLKFNSFK